VVLLFEQLLLLGGARVINQEGLTCMHLFVVLLWVRLRRQLPRVIRLVHALLLLRGGAPVDQSLAVAGILVRFLFRFAARLLGGLLSLLVLLR
jgi:hypothetical protein